MAVAQSTYSASITAGYPGMVANGETSNRISRTVEDSGGIAFGKAAFRGSGDHGITATPTEGAFVGVTMIDPAITPVPGGAAADIIPRYASAPLLDMGVIWITAAAVSIADGDAVYVTSGGAFTNVVSTNIPIPATFMDTAASGGLVRINVKPTIMPAAAS
jgi:hypothetical protein